LQDDKNNFIIEGNNN